MAHCHICRVRKSTYLGRVQSKVFLPVQCDTDLELDSVSSRVSHRRAVFSPAALRSVFNNHINWYRTHNLDSPSSSPATPCGEEVNVFGFFVPRLMRGWATDTGRPPVYSVAVLTNNHHSWTNFLSFFIGRYLSQSLAAGYCCGQLKLIVIKSPWFGVEREPRGRIGCAFKQKTPRGGIFLDSPDGCRQVPPSDYWQTGWLVGKDLQER